MNKITKTNYTKILQKHYRKCYYKTTREMFTHRYCFQTDSSCLEKEL